jgi:hypothetical protein
VGLGLGYYRLLGRKTDGLLKNLSKIISWGYARDVGLGGTKQEQEEQRAKRACMPICGYKKL